MDLTNEPRMSRKVKVSLVISAIGLIVLLVFLLLGLNRQEPVRAANAVNIGGPFTLLGTKSELVRDSDFAGRPLLIYFGFTYCPDVCPTSLDTLGSALEKLETLAPKAYAQLQPLFISVDPARDTPNAMAEYLAYFHPKIIGLTGNEPQIKAIKKAYRVYAARQPETDANGNYAVDHSSFFYLMDGAHKYAAHFDHGMSAQELAEKLAQKLTQR